VNPRILRPQWRLNHAQVLLTIPLDQGVCEPLIERVALHSVALKYRDTENLGKRVGKGKLASKIGKNHNLNPSVQRHRNGCALAEENNEINQMR
jgi:hypothetical protein